MKVVPFFWLALVGFYVGLPESGATQVSAGRPVLTAPPRPAAANPQSAVASPSALVQNGPTPASSPGYRIGPDDSLQITVWKEQQLSGSLLVRPDGMISMVLLGDVHAAGLTPMQLASTLTERFSKFIQDPLVTVTVVAANSQRIYVLGEVGRVGPIEMSTAMSPLQAIAAAGGLTPYANQKKIYILRGPAGKQQKIPFNYKSAVKGNQSSSITLMAGDTIVVP